MDTITYYYYLQKWLKDDSQFVEGKSTLEQERRLRMGP